MTEEKKPEETKEEEEKKTSSNPLLDEVRAEREALEKARDEARTEADRLSELRSEQLLSGTAGVREEPEEPKEETPAEYAKKVMSGEL